MILKRTYSGMKSHLTFIERFNYLKLCGVVGESTFGCDRYLNQIFYTSKRWKNIRHEIIIRDDGCDLGIDGHQIHDTIYIHHINPITIKDIELDLDWIYDPEYLICSSYNTHQAIHFSDSNLLKKDYIERQPNDTCPWRRRFNG
jgi:hypothetical protein